MLPRWFDEEFPYAAELIQQAGNAPGQIAKHEHELQVVRKIHNAWVAETTRLGPEGRVSFDVVKRRVLRTRPPCAEAVPHMYAFVLKCGGGRDAKYLIDTERIVKQRAQSNSAVGGKLYEALAGLKLSGSSDQAVRFRHALLKVAYCNTKVCVDVQDVAKMKNSNFHAGVVKAEIIMNTMRAIVIESKMDEVDAGGGETHEGLKTDNVDDALYDLDNRLVCHTLKKNHKDQKAYKSMGAIAHECILALSDIKGEKMESTMIESAWKDAAEKDEAEQATAATEKNAPAGRTTAAADKVVMRDFGADGKLDNASQMVAELGFSVGDSVRRKVVLSTAIAHSVSHLDRALCCLFAKTRLQCMAAVFLW